MDNNIEKQRERQLAEIRAKNRASIAWKVAERVLQKLANSSSSVDDISGREIAEFLRPITDEELDYTNVSARKLDFENPEDLINEVKPLISRGIAKLRQAKFLQRKEQPQVQKPQLNNQELKQLDLF